MKKNFEKNNNFALSSKKVLEQSLALLVAFD
jgi:hypothetical protein